MKTSWQRLLVVVVLLATMLFVYRLVVEQSVNKAARHPYDNIVDRFQKSDWQAARRIELLQSEAVKLELGLDSESGGAIEELLSAYTEQAAALWKRREKEYPNESKSLPREVEGLSELVMQADRDLAQHLDAPQQSRLTQLVRRNGGYLFVFEEQVSAELSLSEAQQRAIKDLLVDRTLADTKFRREWRSADESQKVELLEQRDADKLNFQSRFDSILTTAQMAVCKRLLGKEFMPEAASTIR